MAATRKLTVEVLGDARGAQGAFKEISSGTDNLGKQFVDFGKKVAVAFTAVAAGTALFAKQALDAAYEAQKVAAQTEAIIKATGKAAGLTADEVRKLADNLSYATGVDDEVIQSSMNMLLTFKQVRNEVGAGNDVFNRATAAMLDLANVFGSTDSAAMQLGKALSDPIKGISSLRRVGVNFTEAQQEQIKALVKSGDLLSAQKIILGEVESQVGGTARATATYSARMQVAFENLQEKIGGLLLPAFEGLSRTVTERLIPAIEDVVDKYGPRIVDFFKRLWTGITDVTNTIGDALEPVLKRIGDWMSDNTDVVAAFFAVIAGASVIASIAAVGAAIAALFNPITLIIGAIAAVAAGFVYAYKHFENFRDIVDAVGRFLADTVAPAIGTAFSWLGEQIRAFSDGVRTRWEDIRTATQNVFNVVKTYIQAVLTTIQWLWDTFGQTITASVRRAWDAISTIIRGAFEMIRGIFDIFLGILSGNWGRAWDGLKSIVHGALQGVLGVARALWNPIVTTFEMIWQGVKNAAVAPLNALVWIVRGAINTVVDVINRFVDIWNSIQFTAPKVHIPGTNWTIGGFTIGLPDIRRLPHLQEGGIVSSPTIAVIAESGPEAVVPLSRLPQGIGDTHIEIHVSGADPNAVVDALKRYYRQNGAIPIRTVSP
jgi:phage-related protein